MNFKIVNYKKSFARNIAELFFNTIHKTCYKDYTKEQLSAWAPSIDYKLWENKLSKSKPYLILDDDKLIGFCEFYDEYIDCFYIHYKYQRKGVGKALLAFILEVAKEKKIKIVHVDASITSKPFFESFGFSEIKKNKVIRSNQILINYSMIKKL